MIKIGLVGPGRVGRTFAALLPPDRYELGPVLASSWVSTKRAVREMRRGRPARSYEDFGDCEWILISVTAEAFRRVCGDLLDSTLNLTRKVLLYTTAMTFDNDTAALRARGASAGRLYPVDLFHRPNRSLAGVPFLIGGDVRALRAARALVRTFGGEALRPNESESAQAFAAAALLPNALYDLFDLIVEQMASTGVPRKKAVAAISQLVDSTVHEYARSSRQVARESTATSASRDAAERLEALCSEDSAEHVMSSLLSWVMEIHGYDPKKLGAEPAVGGAPFREREYKESEAFAQIEAS